MRQRILAQLELQITRATLDALLQDSHGVDCGEGVLIVAVPNWSGQGLAGGSLDAYVQAHGGTNGRGRSKG